MDQFLNYILWANTWMLIGFSFYILVIKKNFDFQFKRYFLLGSIIIPFILCGIKVSLFSGIATSFTMPAITVNKQSLNSIQSITSSQALIPLTYFIYGFISLAILLSNLIPLAKFMARRKSFNRAEEYYIIPNSKEAFSFLGDIYLGSELSDEERAIVIKHERIHIERKHSFDLILAQLLKVLFFFNPMVYFLKPLMKENHEFEADQAAQVGKKKYIETLLKQYFQTDIEIAQLSHSFNNHHLKQRIMNLKSNNKSKSTVLGLFLSAALVGGLFSGQQLLTAQNSNTSIEKQAQQEEETKPKFPGGQEALINFLVKEIKYPESAKKAKVEGTVFVEIIISEDGRIEDTNVLKGADESLDKEAVRVIRRMPNWEPATKEGKEVRSKMVIPVKFKLS